MRKLFITLASILNFLGMALGQEGNEIAQYKKILALIHSPAFKHHEMSLSQDLISTANNLDKQHPQAFFAEAMKRIEAGRYDDAVFLLNLGRLRFKYYNKIDPNYQAGDGGALASSLSYVVGEPLRIYIKGNIKNYSAIIDAVVSYAKANRKVYPTMKTNTQYYNETVNALNKISLDMKRDLPTLQKNARADLDSLQRELAALEKEREQTKN